MLLCEDFLPRSAGGCVSALLWYVGTSPGGSGTSPHGAVMHLLPPGWELSWKQRWL